MAIEPLECPTCGAKVESGVVACTYCETHYVRPANAIGAVPLRSDPWTIARSRDAGEWGFGTMYVCLGVAAALALYAFGWSLEDRRYFLATPAVVTWGGAVPTVLALTAFGFRARRGLWPGVVIGLTLAMAHVGMYASLRHFRVNDDAVGMAAMFAGAALAGWLLGRGMHEWVRRVRADAESAAR